MKIRLLFALALLSLGAPLHAQTPCSECVQEAEAESRKCLSSAIGPSERNACLDNRQAQIKACSEEDCKVQREEIATMEQQQQAPTRPGLGTYTPTEGEWLALVTRAGLRRESTPDRPYSLDIVLADPQTLQIIVRHTPALDRDALNKAIEGARDAIRKTARGYGWDRWVKIKETVEVVSGKK